MPACGGALWQVVRELYEKTDLTIPQIVAFAEVSRAAIYQRKNREGWVSRRRRGIFKRPVRPAPPALAVLAGAADGETPPDIDRAALARRLWAALDRHLKDLETAEPPAGEARAAQNLATLARTLEKLIEVERDMARDEDGADDRDDEPRDIESLVAEFARRIEAFERGGPAA